MVFRGHRHVVAAGLASYLGTNGEFGLGPRRQRLSVFAPFIIGLLNAVTSFVELLLAPLDAFTI